MSIDGTNMLHLPNLFLNIYLLKQACLTSLVLLFIFYSGDELSVGSINRCELHLDAIFR